MIAKVLSGALVGIRSRLVDVETDIAKGMPLFDVVGLPGSSVREARERVRSAIQNSGFAMPNKRITVNLAPADMRKEGPAFDLPIAISLLVASGIVEQASVDSVFITGELSLDGMIRPVDGVLAMVAELPKMGINRCIVPLDNAYEAAIIEDLEVVAPRSLVELVEHLCGSLLPPAVPTDIREIADLPSASPDISDVHGQESAKRALEIAAAGGHNMIMVGPPGSGKTMLARCMLGILPKPSFEEALDTTKIYSVAGLLQGQTMLTERPFRSPHHSTSYAALVGGGRTVRPGEISLAHGGVLFLDELPEFTRSTLEMLRQPMESADITIHRANSTSVTYPSNFMLLAAMNPCPCGFYGDGGNRCSCSPLDISRYLNKISGPLLDRIDIHVEVSAVKFSYLSTPKSKTSADTSAQVATRVSRATDIARRRYNQDLRNAHLSPPQIEEYCRLGESETNLLRFAFDNMNLSARGYHKILKLARTIADLAAEPDINKTHITEALQYRSLDRKYWN